MSEHAALAFANLQAIRRDAPLIHNITNFVSMDVVANALLALGASPAMVHAEDEVEEFVGIASALVINIGTLSPLWVQAMVRAARAAEVHGRRWVLDPVGVGATSYRTRTAGELAMLRPSVIRGNASEILALAGTRSAAAKGVDSVHRSDEAIDAAAALARQLGTTVAVTGQVDHVTDGTRSLSIANGHPLMTRVTALGCAVSSLIAAFLVVEQDPVVAAAQALGVFGLAGEQAALQAQGPGSLRWRLLDQLAGLDEQQLRMGLKIS